MGVAHAIRRYACQLLRPPKIYNSAINMRIFQYLFPGICIQLKFCTVAAKTNKTDELGKRNITEKRYSDSGKSGREGERERSKEGGRERERWRDGGREGERERWRRMEGEMEGEMEGSREGEREAGKAAEKQRGKKRRGSHDCFCFLYLYLYLYSLSFIDPFNKLLRPVYSLNKSEIINEIENNSKGKLKII